MINFIEAFPTVIARVDLSKEFDFKQIENFLSNISLEDHFMLLNGKSSFMSPNQGLGLLNTKELESLKNKLQILVDEYSDEIGIEKTPINYSWHSVMNENSTLLTHRHEGSVVTGALYVNAEEGSSPLTFETPLSSFRMCEKVVKDTDYSSRGIHVSCETGILYLFPSWLRHGSILKNYNNNRIVISFNTRPIWD